MAFNWTNISNGEAAISVRNKINSLGTVCTKTAQMINIVTDIICPVSQWQTDTQSTYNEFPYKADLSIQGVTANDIPIVNFAPEQQISGNFIGAVSGAGIITIWAREIPATSFIIPNITILREVE